MLNNILNSIDKFFLGLEGKPNNPENSTSKAQVKAVAKVQAIKTHKAEGLGSLLYKLYVSKEYADKGLQGWRDDKEKFKIDLLNDIKDFLFTKWEKPWKAGLIFDSNNNVISGFRNVSGRVYKGQSNIISLEINKGASPYFITIDKIDKDGGKITDKTKVTTIVSAIPIVEEEDITGKVKYVVPKFHSVINVDFVEGIKKPKFKTEDFKELELNEYVENFIKLLAIQKRIPKLYYDQADRAYYTHSELSWKNDSIHLAPIRQFKNIEGYYETLFHEITHSTMNPERCGRGKHKNASLSYANEELVAEMGAMIICSELGLNYNRQNSLTYLTGWLKKAGNDKDTALIEAYAYACDAAEYLMKGINFEKLVPKTMVDRVKENENEDKPTPQKEKPQPKYKVGDKVSFEMSGKKHTDIVKSVAWEQHELIGIKTEGYYYRLLAYGNFAVNETDLTIVEPKPKDLFDTILPRTKPDELSYNLAYNAHRGTSFSPEKRAKSHQEEYATSLNSYAEQFEALIKSDEQKNIAIEEFERFKKGYTDKYNAWLRAKSNCLSTMITGASKFPVRKAEKANEAEHKRLTEFIEWEERAEKAIVAKIKGKAPKDVADAERWERHKKDILSDIATIIAIEQGKTHLSKPLITGALKRFLMALHRGRFFADFKKGLELVKEAQEKHKMVIFAPNNPIWKLESEITTSTEEDEPQNKATETIYKAEGCEVVNNYEMERVQMAFNGKPAAEVITILKKNVFKWSPSQKVWQRQNTTNGINAALSIAKKFFPNNEPTPEPEKPIKKASEKVEIIDTPIKDIYTDEKRFQNRKNAFSEDSKNRIIKAVQNGTFNWAKFDPVLLWFDPLAKRNYVLSGHSRYAAFKELASSNKDFSKIPSRLFAGTEAQAIEAALNSNTLSTKETEVERAMYYSKQRNACEMRNANGLGAKTDCEKQVETACKDSEGKNANYILNLSYLNPEGYLIDTLSSLGVEKDNDSTNVLRTIANWIGEARRNNHEITNTQESEIANFLLNGGYGNKTGQFRNKAQFNERLDYSFNKWKANGADQNKPLNLANTLSKSSFEKEYDERIETAKEALNNAIAEHEEKYKKYLFAVMDGSMKQERMDELMKPIIGYVERAKKELERLRGQKEEVKKAASAQTSLFGLNDVNEQFNTELEQLINGKLPKNHVFNLGMPSGALLSAGLEYLTIEMPATTLLIKSSNDYKSKHPFEISDVINLPNAIAQPIAIFEAELEPLRKVVLTELKDKKGVNFICILDLFEKRAYGKNAIVVNSIISLYPKASAVHIAKWFLGKECSEIGRDLLLWVDKKSALKWSSDHSSYVNAVKLSSKRIANIIQNFENPKPPANTLNGLNNNLFGLQGINTIKKGKTYRLFGDLGKFLGEFDRNNYTIVLRGDKGAGKSRLLYQLINAFAAKQYSVAFLSLEMALNSSITQRYKNEYISKRNIKRVDITAQAPTYEDLNAICKKYDVVAIDSWTKLKNITQQDFDRLQKENPHTIIICIFQSTTGRVTRGGNMPEYDAGTVIQVNKGGVAICEKNRYTATNSEYLVFDKKLKTETAIAEVV